MYATVKAMSEIWTEFCLFDSGISVRGYLKSKVYSDPVPKTTEELRKSIRREARRRQLSTVQSAVDINMCSPIEDDGSSR